jgi:hypothetical protein
MFEMHEMWELLNHSVVDQGGSVDEVKVFGLSLKLNITGKIFDAQIFRD